MVFASIGVLRLGNNVGSKKCNTVPRVWGSRELDKFGVTNDWTTRRWPDVGSEAAGDEGRYIFKGTCRNGAPCAYSNLFVIRLKAFESSGRKLCQPAKLLN